MTKKKILTAKPCNLLRLYNGHTMTPEAPVGTIAIIQLSDFHFKDEDHPALGRGDAIVTALLSMIQPIGTIFVALTGDLAFSGAIEEYKLADAFLRDLLDRLSQKLPGIAVHVLLVPGNHDCDLTGHIDIRDFELISPRLEALDPDGTIATESLRVHDNYFKFATDFGQLHTAAIDKFAKRLEFAVLDDYRVAFSLYNTAWLSKVPEQPGQLHIPKATFLTADTPADLEVTLIHHPPNWLEPNNMLAFREHLANNADLVLYGHQHQKGALKMEDEYGQSFNVVEGLAMHDPRATQNGFQVMLIAPSERSWNLRRFVWDATAYVPDTTPTDWKPLTRNKALEEQSFGNTTKFAEHLQDPGVAFTHGSKQQVLLSDIFIYPDLQQRDLQRKVEEGKPSTIVVRGPDVPNWIHQHKHVVLIGDDKSGKTALGKTLYKDLRRHHDVVSLLIGPDTVNAFKPGTLATLPSVPT